MALFATADDLADRLGVTFSASEIDRAETLLTLASGLIQEETRQQIELVEDDEFTVHGLTEGMILLPERPVVSVASVTLDGDPIAADTYHVDGDYLVRSGVAWGEFLGGYEWFGWGDSPLVVTYTHGFSSIPDAIRAVCLEVAVRAYVNPGSVTQEAYGSERTSYGAVGLSLTPDERRIVRRVTRRRTESLAIR
jgi:hypothetical protein